MSRIAIAMLASLITASALNGQDRVRAAVALGYGGGGPLGVVVKSATAEVAVSRDLAITASAMTLSHGYGVCNAHTPNRCDGDATAAAIGVSTTFMRDSARVAPMVALQVGVHDFSGIGGGQVPVFVDGGRRPMIGALAGIRVRLVAGLGAQLVLKQLFVLDDEQYVAELGKHLRYTLPSVGLSYSWR